MPIEFRCPGCQSLIRTPDGSGGKHARCPRCSATVSIPHQSAAEELPSLEPAPSPPGPAFNPPPARHDPYSPTPPANDPYALQPSKPDPGANPFGDMSAQPAGSTPGQFNPYASPGYGPALRPPVTPEIARQKLLIPAIALAITTFFCLGYGLLTILMFMLQPEEFLEGAPPANKEAERIAFYFALYAVMIVMVVAPLIVAAGTVSMFRGRGWGLALIGAVTSVLPCNPCCVVGLPFGIWALVVLNQADVRAAMR